MTGTGDTERRIGHALVGASVLFVGLYLIAALGRVGYPFELEWMEGAAVDHLRNILSGGKLYPEPNLTFVPFIYNPLYFLLSAAVATVTGTGFLPLRIVSIAASVTLFGFIYAIAARETGDRRTGIVAAGLFAATYEISGRWFDIGRVDSLFLALMLGSVYLVRFGPGIGSALLAALLGALAFFTKQTALIIVGALALYLLAASLRRGVAFSLASLAAIGAGVGWLYRLYGEWYLFYVFDLPSQHGIVGRLIYSFWTEDILRSFTVAALLTAIYLFPYLPGVAAAMRTGVPLDRERASFSITIPTTTLFYLCLGAGMVLGAWSSRLHSGGWLNVLMPAYAFLSVTAAIAAHSIGGRLHDGSMRLVGLGRKDLMLLLLVQFVVLLYNPAAAVPSARDEAAGRRLIALIAAIPGEVFVPYHGYLPSLAGKGRHIHQMAYHDIMRGTDSVAVGAMETAMNDAIRERRFAAIIVDDEKPFVKDLDTYYTRTWRVFDDPSVFWPKSGIELRPEYIYYPKR